MGDDRLEAWYGAFISEQDLLIQVQGVLCCIGQEFGSFTQAHPMELETLCPFISGSSCLPFCRGTVHLQFFHGLYDSIDSGGAQDDWNPGGEPAGVIQDEDDLLFIIVGHPLYLDSHHGEAYGLHLMTAQSYQWNVVLERIKGVVQF